MKNENKKNISFYVATNGNDNWSGTLSEPNVSRSDGPFATLYRAKEVVRTIKANEKDIPVDVIVAGGIYMLTDPLLLNEKDSGTKSGPVRWIAEEKSRVILSGGRRLTGWWPVGNGIFACTLTEARAGRLQSRQLFLDGERLPRARLPKKNAESPWFLTKAPIEDKELLKFTYYEGNIPVIKNPQEIEVVIYPYAEWCNNIIPIRHIDYDKCTMELLHSGKDFDVKPWFWPTTIVPNNRYCLENGLDFITEPGEWCISATEGCVYYMPEPGIDPNDQQLVLPILDTLVELRNTDYITLDGFTFTHSLDGDNTHPHGLDGVGAFFPMPGMKKCGYGVLIHNCDYVKVDSCTFDQVGSNAIYLTGGSHGCVIDNCVIDRPGANGICVVGSQIKEPDCGWHKGRYNGRGVGRGHPTSCKVVNNRISRNGYLNSYTQAIFTGLCDGLLVAHNLSEYAPTMAFCLGSNHYGRIVIEYNRIRYSGLDGNDNGAIHFWMEDDLPQERAGHVLRYNYISNIGSVSIDRENTLPYHTAVGIYIDNLSSNNFLYGNIIARVEGHGIMIHTGKNNVLENNIIYDCEPDALDKSSNKGSFTCINGFAPVSHMYSCNWFSRNVLVNRHPYVPQVNISNTKYLFAECDNNLFWRNDGFEPVLCVNGKTQSLDAWHDLGYDLHSVVGDPIFRDPEADDFSFPDTSPLCQIGFMPIDMSKIGPQRKPRLVNHY